MTIAEMQVRNDARCDALDERLGKLEGSTKEQLRNLDGSTKEQLRNMSDVIQELRDQFACRSPPSSDASTAVGPASTPAPAAPIARPEVLEVKGWLFNTMGAQIVRDVQDNMRRTDVPCDGLVHARAPYSRANRCMLTFTNGFAATAYLDAWRRYSDQHPMAWRSNTGRRLYLTKWQPPPNTSEERARLEDLRGLEGGPARR